MEYNEYLKPWLNPRPNKRAGKGYIEHPDKIENIVWQTRSAVPTSYENKLADILIEAFDTGIEDLEPLVNYLVSKDFYSPDGIPWTIETFKREMARLGGS